MTDTPLHIACPACHGLNRVPAVRLADGPVCGRCRQPLFAAHPVALDAAGFERHVVQSDLPVLVDFWAPWCAPCRAMAPQFEAAARQLAGQVVFAKVDTEAAPEVSARHRIRSIPTMVLFSGGREIARVSGAMPAADLSRWLSQALRGAA